MGSDFSIIHILCHDIGSCTLGNRFLKDGLDEFRFFGFNLKRHQFLTLLIDLSAFYKLISERRRTSRIYALLSELAHSSTDSR